MKTLVNEIRNYGLKVAVGNMLIIFTKWFVGAKRIRLTYILVACALFASCGGGINENWFIQAFGDYVRSMEGQANLEKVPALIIAGRDKWLPAGEKWDALAAGIIREYVKANPQNNAELNKVLEGIAMKLNTVR